jgi:hypothetical protein
MLAANASRYGVLRVVDKTDGRKLLDTADIVIALGKAWKRRNRE